MKIIVYKLGIYMQGLSMSLWKNPIEGPKSIAYGFHVLAAKFLVNSDCNFHFLDDAVEVFFGRE